jgi:hypothetical protein
LTREEAAALLLGVALVAAILLSMAPPSDEPIACRGTVAQCWEVE